MTQRIRMLRTLTCLVVAMSGTAALLGWIDPSDPASLDAAAADEIVQLTRAVVEEDVAVVQGRWRSVEVRWEPGPAPSGAMLAASDYAEPCHFFLAPDGRPTRGLYWQHQTAAPGRAGVITIHLASHGRGNPLTPGQHFGLRALLLALHSAAGRGEHPLAVYLQDPPDDNLTAASAPGRGRTGRQLAAPSPG